MKKKGECESIEQVINNSPEYMPYIPEFSLKIDYSNQFVMNTNFSSLIYLKIERKTWINAVRASYFKRKQQIDVINI